MSGAEEEWTSSANDAVQISLVTSSTAGLETLGTFHPKFTYPIFGESEQIFGYKGLKIDLKYNASDLRPNITINSSKKFRVVSDVEPVDIPGTLKDFLPGVAFQRHSDFEAAINTAPKSWTPPGSLLKSVETKSGSYEIWKGNLGDRAVRQLIRRIQVMVLFFIEGGSYIIDNEEGAITAGDSEESSHPLDRWTVFFLYKKQPTTNTRSQYIFQGYSTIYKFWMYQQLTPPSSPKSGNEEWELPTGEFSFSQAPHRARISQFVILPPFQGTGMGAVLYDAIFEEYSKDSHTKEITVEDPNEAFDLLRDLCDLKYLRTNVPEFSELKVNSAVNIPSKGGYLHNGTNISENENETESLGIVDITAIEALRVKVKIAPRQFSRLVEMHLMSKLPLSVRPRPDSEANSFAPKSDQHQYNLWRLLIKQRVYRRNVSVLGEFEVTDRIIKLNETLDNVEWEYARILDRYESRPSLQGNGSGKRKLEDANGSTATKKVRISEPGESSSS